MDSKPDTHKNSSRSTILVCLGVAAAAALTATWWYNHFGPGYTQDLRTVEAELSSIPGVEIIKVNYVEDTDLPFLPYIKHISAHVKVEGAGEMVFRGLSPDSFRDSGPVVLSSIGDTAFRYRGRGYLGGYQAATGAPSISESLGGNMSIGNGGKFATAFPFAIPNIQTAVKRYHEISNIVNSWPRSPLPPKHLQTPDKIDYLYWQYDKNEKDLHDSLWDTSFSELLEEASNGKEA